MAKEKDTAPAEKSADASQAKIEPASPVVSAAEPIKVETLSAKENAPVDPAADGPGLYRVTLNAGKEDAESATVEAEGRKHAWALFCDGRESWPSPKRVDRKIEKVG